MDLIKFLPMDEAVRTQMLNLYDHMKPDKQANIARIAWNAYYLLFDQQLQANLQLQFDQVLHGQEHFDKEYYARALKKTEKEMTESFQKTVESMDLAIARKAMEQIVKEIRAAKKN
jgi:hypothetical protein